MNSVLSVCILVSVITLSLGYRDALSDVERETVVSLHNLFRADLSQGGISGWLPISNMPFIEWDSELEIISAMKEAYQCVNAKPSKYFEPSALIFESFAQQNYEESIAQQLKHYQSLLKSIPAHLFMARCANNTACNDAIKILSASVMRMGCSKVHCGYKTVFVCLYDNVPRVAEIQPSRRLFKLGKPCSKCNEGSKECLLNALCSTRRQCELSRFSNGKCGGQRRFRYYALSSSTKPDCSNVSPASCSDEKFLFWCPKALCPEPAPCKDNKHLCQIQEVNSLCYTTCKDIAPRSNDEFPIRQDCVPKKDSCTEKKFQINCVSICPEPATCKSLDVANACNDDLGKKICWEKCKVCQQDDRRTRACLLLKQAGLCKRPDIIVKCPRTCGKCAW